MMVEGIDITLHLYGEVLREFESLFLELILFKMNILPFLAPNEIVDLFV